MATKRNGIIIEIGREGPPGSFRRDPRARFSSNTRSLKRLCKVVFSRWATNISLLRIYRCNLSCTHDRAPWLFSELQGVAKMEMARQTGLSVPTVRKYLKMLEV